MTHEYELEEVIKTSLLQTTTKSEARLSENVDELLGGRSKTSAKNPVKPMQAIGEIMQSPRMLKRVAPSISILVTILAVGLCWGLRSTVTWAQVVEAVNQKSWMRMTGETPEGVVITWSSQKHQIFAIQSPQRVSISRFQDDVTESYSPDTKQIFKSAAEKKSSERVGFDSFNALFGMLERGDEVLDLEEFREENSIESIEQSRKEIEIDSIKFFDYRITLQPQEEAASTMTIRINSETRLPNQVTVNNSGQPEVIFQVDFPETGPLDIYSMGVPENTQIVDQTPQGVSPEFKEIVDQMQAAVVGFDDYRGIIVLSDPDHPWHVGTPQIVWRKGNFRRMDFGFIDTNNSQPTVDPAADLDRQQWWQNRCKLLYFRPIQVSESGLVYSNNYTPKDDDFAARNSHPIKLDAKKWSKTQWKKFGKIENWQGRTSPLHSTYPHISGFFTNSTSYDTKVVRDPSDEEKGTLLVTVDFSSSPVGEQQTDRPLTMNQVKYVLDSRKNYAVLRSSTIVYAEQDGESEVQSQNEVVNRDFKQSPKGFWYPTLIINKHEFSMNGQQHTGENVSRVYLDFEIEMPDKLFQQSKSNSLGIPK